ncbi:MAG: hypothetical protein DRN40_06200 [Thermoplasmata archaeon]|nr:MAG: hypothetical protein DRN40_06200 [Thermoplasmata archaeon]
MGQARSRIWDVHKRVLGHDYGTGEVTFTGRAFVRLRSRLWDVVGGEVFKRFSPPPWSRQTLYVIIVKKCEVRGMVEEDSNEKLQEILDRVYRWGVEFSKSEYFEELTEEEKEESEFVIMTFTEYMYTHHGLSPEEWDEEGVKECCLYTLPGKIAEGESYFKSVVPVLSAFFAFLGKKDLLRNAIRLILTVKEIDKQIVRNARDPKNWGIAKSFVMAAKAAGVDITDEEEMRKFIEIYNMQQLAIEGIKSKKSRRESKKSRR